MRSWLARRQRSPRAGACALLQARVERAGRRRAADQPIPPEERFWADHRRRFAALTPESHRGIGRACFESASRTDRRPEIGRPSLVRVGGHDREWLPGADLFAQTLPRVTCRTIPGAAHHPHQDNPEALLAAVEAHLADVERADREQGVSA